MARDLLPAKSCLAPRDMFASALGVPLRCLWSRWLKVGEEYRTRESVGTVPAAEEAGNIAQCVHLTHGSVACLLTSACTLLTSPCFITGRLMTDDCHCCCSSWQAVSSTRSRQKGSLRNRTGIPGFDRIGTSLALLPSSLTPRSRTARTNAHRPLMDCAAHVDQPICLPVSSVDRSSRLPRLASGHRRSPPIVLLYEYPMPGKAARQADRSSSKGPGTVPTSRGFLLRGRLDDAGNASCHIWQLLQHPIIMPDWAQHG